MNIFKKMKIKGILKDYTQQAYEIMCKFLSYDQYDELDKLSKKLEEELSQLQITDKECKELIELFKNNNEEISKNVKKEDREILRESKEKIRDINWDKNLTSKEKLEAIEKIKEEYYSRIRNEHVKTEFMAEYIVIENKLKNENDLEQGIKSTKRINKMLDNARNSEGNKAIDAITSREAERTLQMIENEKNENLIKDYQKNNKYAQIMEKLKIYNSLGLYMGTEEEVLAELNYNALKEDGIEYLIFLPYFRMLESIGVSNNTIKEKYNSINIPNTVRASDIYAGVVFLVEMGIVTKEEAKMFFNGNDINYETYLELSKNLPNNFMNTIYKFKNELPENYKRFASENSAIKK